MKVNALVVAAMVITSVNAVWHDVFTGCFRGRCGMSKSESEESLLQKDGDEPKVPKPTKASPKCGSIVKELTDLRGEPMILRLLLGDSAADPFQSNEGDGPG
ncbi:hypothetical protein BASA60_006560 [Batrachochytrium salamandrivorans]|nr:hypothetical protein BASA60_006560 [Batrachochytrium salamandrivorans]